MENYDRTQLIWPLAIKYKYLQKIPDWISTTMLFSTGILFIPVLYDFA